MQLYCHSTDIIDKTCARFFPGLLILLAVLGLIATPVLFSANAEIRRADAALAAARPLEAVADLEHAATLFFWRTDLMERAGRAAFAGEDMSAAVRLLGQSSHLSVDGWRDLGAAYYQLGRFDESVRALQRGLDTSGGTNASLYRGLALAHNAQGDYESETAALQNYIALDDADAAAVRWGCSLPSTIQTPLSATVWVCSFPFLILITPCPN